MKNHIPSVPLEVSGAIQSTNFANNYAAELVSETGGPRLNLGSATDSDLYLDLGAYGGINNLYTTTRDLHIYGSTHATGAYFDVSTNKWGFGDNQPDHMLSVKGENRNFLKFQRTNTDATASVSWDLFRNTEQALLYMELGDDDTDYKIGTPSNGLMFVSSSGNVGIGTMTPGKKLEVSGDISASGNIRAATIGMTNIVTNYLLIFQVKTIWISINIQ